MRLFKRFYQGINVLFCVVFRAFSNRQDACSFFAFYSLKDVLKSCEPAGVLVRVELNEFI